VVQTAQLIEAARETRLFIPVLLAVLCGLRRGEIAALRWQSVDLDTGKLAITQSAEQGARSVRCKEPKSGRARNVLISPMLTEEFKAWRAAQAQEFLRLGVRPESETFAVTKPTGAPLRPSTITRAWVEFLKTTTLPRIRFHDLRHAHATHMLTTGVHPKVASERLGHSKIAITLDLYSHVMPGMQEDAVARVDAALRAAMKSTPGTA